MSHNRKSTKRVEAWSSSSSESVTNRDAEEIKNNRDTQRKKEKAENRPDKWSGPTYRRWYYNTEEINRKEEAEMKQRGCGDQR